MQTWSPATSSGQCPWRPDGAGFWPLSGPLYETSEEYARPVKTYLNHYLAKNRNRIDVESLKEVFLDAAEVINQKIGSKAFRPVRPLNAAVLDAIMVGVM